MNVPEGWQPHTRHSPLTDPWQPIHALEQPRALQLGLQVCHEHCNSRGLAHGGLIAALADKAMGLSAVRAALADGLDLRGAVTASLALDYLDSARIGDWLQVQPVVLKTGRTLSFVECHVLSGDRVVARGNATFRMQ